MKCKAARRRLSACVDRDLTFEEEARLREHLQDCGDCARELERVERMVALLESLPETDPGPGFFAAVQRRIQQEQGAAAAARPEREVRARLCAWLRLPVVRPALCAASLGLVVGILVGLSGAPQMATLLRGTQAPDAVFVSTDTPEEPSAAATVESYRSPIADLDLSRFEALGDTIHLENEPEFVLERYTADPQRGLVPVEPGTRTVTSSQSDGFITF